jgi:hypothetical protein
LTHPGETRIEIGNNGSLERTAAKWFTLPRRSHRFSFAGRTDFTDSRD